MGLGERLGEAHSEFCFLVEALYEPHILAELRIEDLDGDLLAVSQILTEIDPGHATIAQFGD